MLPDEAAAVVARGCEGYEETLQRNWNGNVHFGGRPVVPRSIEELQDVVRNCNTVVRVVGRGHSFSLLAECQGGTLISLARLNKVIDFVPPTSQNVVGSITVQGGTTYTEIAQFLGKQGALRNLPSCPQFTVAGAIATATHGSGINSYNLAADVSMMEFVTSDGSLVRYSRELNLELLEGCRVHLGCLGVVSQLTLDVVHYFEVEAIRYDDVSLETMIQELPDLWTRCDSLSVWTSGLGRGQGEGHCWMTFRHFLPYYKSSVAVPEHSIPSKLLGDSGKLCDRAINRYCTDVDNPVTFRPTSRFPWHDGLTITMADCQETSMHTVDIQAEFFVPLEHAQAAIRAVWDVAREWDFSSPWGYTGDNPKRQFVDAMEFRQVKGGDGSWLSPHPIDSLGIHISFNGDPGYLPEVMEKLPLLEQALESFGARPHWGKLAPFTFASARIEKLYGGGNLERFRKLCHEHDPSGKFRNAHISRMLFAIDESESRSS